MIINIYCRYSPLHAIPDNATQYPAMLVLTGVPLGKCNALLNCKPSHGVFRAGF